MPSNEDELPPDPFADEAIEIDVEDDPIDLTNMWLRKFSWDIIQCADVQNMQKTIGLTPTDQESAELEHLESHRRMARVSALEPVVDDWSSLVAKVLTAYLLDISSESIKAQVTEEVNIKLTRQNAEVLRIGTLAIVASLLETGVIGYTEKVIGHARTREAAEHEQEQDDDGSK